MEKWSYSNCKEGNNTHTQPYDVATEVYSTYASVVDLQATMHTTRCQTDCHDVAKS